MNSKYVSIGLITMMVLAGCATTGSPQGPDYDKGQKRAAAVTIKQSDRGTVITSDERILFDTGKSDVTSNGQVFIERVAKILNEKTKANVSVEGHTDNVGTADFNQRLSERRASAVMQALVAKGVSKNRITMKGFGATKPVASNDTPEGRQSNRRTEIIVLGEKAENLGGSSLADDLSAGLDRFLKNAGEFIQGVFGGKK